MLFILSFEGQNNVNVLLENMQCPRYIDINVMFTKHVSHSLRNET
jgi:hypothetical protein